VTNYSYLLAALSSTPLTQAARALPALDAACSYRSRRSLDSRSSYRSSSGFSTGGRPTGRFWLMGWIMPVQIVLDKGCG
jgi:hypothetical protein